MTVPMSIRLCFRVAVMAAALAWAAPAAAQVEPCAPAAKQPPKDSPLLVRCITLYAHPINETEVDQATYAYYIKAPYTVPSADKWVPYDEAEIAALNADFWGLWKTTFLDNLWIEVIDEPFENGTPAKHIVFHIEERARIRAVDYVAWPGTKTTVDISKIEEKLRDTEVHLAIDSFVDESTIRRVKGTIRELYSAKGYNDVKIEHDLKAMAAGKKRVTLTFTIDQGPKYKLAEVAFDGNHAFSDAQLRGKMKDNKPKAWWSFFTSGGTYLQEKFSDDAILVNEHYLNNGYVRAIVGQPRVETVRDSKDGKTRWIRLRIPIEEGKRYRIGTFTIAENVALRTEPLRAMFKVAEGDWYDHAKIGKGLDKAKDVYGSLGFWQFYPEPSPALRGVDPETGRPIGPEEPPAIVDVTIKMNEGKKYYVNRITFTGNTTTHDAVARRELRVLEEGPLDTMALKESIRRLNQLGYFKPLEGKPGEVDIEPTPGRDGLVDIKLKFEEQNRNQISFGAGVSQYDGFFGQLSYQTSNFLGRGETLGINLQKGTRARQYMVSFSEPYLFDRPLTAGIELFARQYTYPYQFSQDSIGGTTVVGYPITRNTRAFMGYGYEKTRVYDIEAAYLAAALGSQNPFLRQSLLLDYGGYRRVSKIMPSVVYNTINVPIFPDSGTRYSASFELAGPGGNTYYQKMRLEGIWYFPIPKAKRVTLGMRLEGQWISPRGPAAVLPIFEKFFIGGEYTVRGFDMRTIGPRDSVTGIVTGGNKTVVFNAELAFMIAGPVRLLGFFDAGQVRDVGESFGWWQYHNRVVPFDRGTLSDPFTNTILTAEPYVPTIETWAKSYAFKTSTGVELRFFMPVLNVPFRLIGAYNPSRFGVLNNNLQPTKQFTFRFAVGTTF